MTVFSPPVGPVLAEGVQLELTLSDTEPLAPLPVDLAALPGAALTASLAWRLPSGGRLDVACARASTWLWVDGLEGPLLDGASALARDQLGLGALIPAAVERRDDGFAQPFRGEGMIGRHLLAFANGDAHLCTLVSRGPDGEDALASARIAGGTSAAPHGAASAAITGALGHPRISLSAMGICAALLATWILWRRPRRP